MTRLADVFEDCGCKLAGIRVHIEALRTTKERIRHHIRLLEDLRAKRKNLRELAAKNGRTTKYLIEIMW